MRIISGKYKGHPLVSFEARHIRPTTDRVKETLFNKFMGEVEGARVLDLFSGTGSLGLESISRGAKFCQFVDDHRKSLEILKKNIQKLKVPESEYGILQKDALSFLSKYEGEPFDLILIDPPFTEKMAHEVLVTLSQSKVFHPQTKMAIESVKKERMEDNYAPILRYDFRDYGDKILSFFHVSDDN